MSQRILPRAENTPRRQLRCACVGCDPVLRIGLAFEQQLHRIATAAANWTKYAQAMIDAFDLALRNKFGNGIRIHWGQLLRDPDADQMCGMHPRYDRWRAIRDELDPKGRFLNDWQNKILPPRAR